MSLKQLKLITKEYNGLKFISLRRYKNMPYCDRLIFIIGMKEKE